MGFYESVPPSLQAIIQNGLLDKVFEDALVPLFLFEPLLRNDPWQGGMGSTAIRTRSGLLSVSTTPVTGSDASADAYGFEQYTIRQDQYGKSIDTNMATSAFALASKFLQDQRTLGINASQTKNRLARNALYNAYGQGTTWATAASTSSTTLEVYDATGFQFATALMSTTGTNPSEGDTGVAVPQLVPVSSSNPLNVLVNGVANTVTGVNLSGGLGAMTLTLGTAVSASVGWAVTCAADRVSAGSNGPVQYRPIASGTMRSSAYQIASGDVATLSLFQSAITRLAKMNVPMLNGAYTAHIDPVTREELFTDTQFLNAYRGQGQSPAYRDFSMGAPIGDQGSFLGRFSGIDWIVNNELPNYNPTGSLPVYRCIVAGAESAIVSPFSEMENLLRDLPQNATGLTDIRSFAGGTYRVLRGPLDRFGQVVSSTWAWIGGYGVGTDLLTGDTAAYKRAVVVEHA